MTKAEREARAVADHRCPRCAIQAHFRCRRFVKTRLIYLTHPHAERLELVDAGVTAAAVASHPVEVTG